MCVLTVKPICRLVKYLEQFKATREEAKACHIAQMLLGLQPWLDPEFCKLYPDWMHGFERYCEEWGKHVMRCPQFVSPVQLQRDWDHVWRPASDAVFAGDPESHLEQVLAYYPVYCHPCIMDLLYQVDEYTRWRCLMKPQQGNVVFKEPHEQLGFYRSQDCNISPSSSKAKKLHLCNVVGPSGVLCTFIFCSGSSRSAKEKQSTPWWWDLIPIRLRQQDMPGGVDPERVRAKLASKIWKV